MREILFRGKRIDNGEWVQGYLSFHYVDGKNKDEFVYSGRSQIYVQSDCKNYVVITDTIGQYTGMTDRNGNKIFEGDKVAFVDFLNGWETECIGEVLFSEYGWHFTNSITESNMHSYEPDDIEIIGNIHDEEE